MNPAIAWALAAVTALSPYRVTKNYPVSMFRYGADASEEAYDARMKSIAEDAVDVVKNSQPLPGMSKLATLRVLLSVSYFESGFSRDVDYGTGKYGRGDHGQSWCLMQIHVGKGTVGQLSNKVPEEMQSWKGKDLVEDRKKCFRVGLEMLRHSMGMCSYLPASSRLSAYAIGTCSEKDEKGRARYRFTGGKVLGKHMDPDARTELGDAKK